ncbi:hypothetical protein PBI_PAEDORE_81 [Streptomyces phage Paedore]|uniref:Uncharacterized protein n=1 Tax=Streptomyces phage Paedore TaxID=2108134 RepID=A0A2P1JTX6_9CAUD|nr:hypothetical protein KGG91_gp81 [Streptomyces phage Paedore]AVO22564.1 hypothetical protein PBI_PAEDORE_81 [Streptomyces phage Paedore]
MAATDRITMNIKGHGQYQTDAEHFDMLMARHLPASVEELRAQIQERTTEIDYSDLATVTECLMVLAEYSGYATN